MWVLNSRAVPERGIVAEVVSVAPVAGPFYGTGDRALVTGAPPTDSHGLVVLLNAVPGDIELSLFRLDDPAVTERLTVPTGLDVVTFYQASMGL